MTLAVDGLSFAYGRKPVLHDISLPELKPGTLTALIGPNATGKSTLFKCVAGLLKTVPGMVCFGGRAAASLGSRAWTEKVCYLPQAFTSNAALTVFEIVLLARKHGHGWRVEDGDVEAVAAVLRKLQIEHLAETFIGDLSGGQQQMASIAQALVRTPDIFLLDEPTSALDLRHQLEIMQTIQAVTRERGIITIVALHDLNLAVRFADTALLIRDGHLVADGSPADVMASEVLVETYGVQVELHETPGGLLTVAARL